MTSDEKIEKLNSAIRNTAEIVCNDHGMPLGLTYRTNGGMYRTAIFPVDAPHDTREQAAKCVKDGCANHIAG